jgi:hypothetical protein
VLRGDDARALDNVMASLPALYEERVTVRGRLGHLAGRVLYEQLTFQEEAAAQDMSAFLHWLHVEDSLVSSIREIEGCAQDAVGAGLSL